MPDVNGLTDNGKVMVDKNELERLYRIERVFNGVKEDPYKLEQECNTYYVTLDDYYAGGKAAAYEHCMEMLDVHDYVK